MRKFLLSLALVALASVASAQITFERIIDHQSAGMIEPGTFTITGELDAMQELSFAMNVINNGSEAVSVVCEREIISQVGEPGNNFCFGGCFPDNVATSEIMIDPISGMDPDALYYPFEFSAHFKPYDPVTWEVFTELTELTVQYTFTERGSEPMVFEFHFIYDPNPVNEINFAEAFSNAYPNPANSVVSIDYSLPMGAQSAAIAIYNMMGQEVIRQDVNTGDSKLNVNVSDLTDGVYFYSLIVNNQTVKTNKLVISK